MEGRVLNSVAASELSGANDGSNTLSRDKFEDEVNVHLGRRLRRRRKLLGLTQMNLAAATGLQFQQIQKYECGMTRISAARLHTLAAALNAPVHYFFQGLAPQPGAAVANDATADDLLSSKEARELIEVYYKLNDRVRGKLRDFAKVLCEEAAPTPSRPQARAES